MVLHLFSARRLAEELAAGRVSARQQAFYLAASFWIWLLPFYFYIARPALSGDYPFFMIYWWTEFAMLLVFHAAGVFHCLRQCRINPERHFMIDFGCLYAPVSLTVLAGTWAAFYAILWTIHFSTPYLESLGSSRWDDRRIGYYYERFHDLLRYFVVVGQVALVYWRVGHHMRRVAELRT